MAIVEIKHIREISRMMGITAKAYNMPGIILTAIYVLTQSPEQMLYDLLTLITSFPFRGCENRGTNGLNNVPE